MWQFSSISGGGELWSSRTERRQSAVTNHCWLSVSACEWGEWCVRMFNLRHVLLWRDGCWLALSAHVLGAVLKGWREDYFANDPLWESVSAAGSRISWCSIIHWEIMNVLKHIVSRSLLKLFRSKLKHRFHILKKCSDEYVRNSWL